MFGDIFDSEVARETKEYTFGPYTVSVSCVAGENQHIDKWVPLVVWRAAEAFSTELATNSCLHAELEGKRLVELGSGTGMCGLVAAMINKELAVLTDGSEDSVEALEDSIAINGLEDRVHGRLLQWGDVKAAEALNKEFNDKPFDVCIATDVIYEAAAVRPLIVSANELVSSTGSFFLANHRFRFQGLLEEIRKHVIDFPFELKEVTRIGTDVDLYIFRRPTAS